MASSHTMSDSETIWKLVKRVERQSNHFTKMLIGTLNFDTTGRQGEIGDCDKTCG